MNFEEEYLVTDFIGSNLTSFEDSEEDDKKLNVDGAYIDSEDDDEDDNRDIQFELDKKDNAEVLPKIKKNDDQILDDKKKNDKANEDISPSSRIFNMINHFSDIVLFTLAILVYLCAFEFKKITDFLPVIINIFKHIVFSKKDKDCVTCLSIKKSK